MIKFRRMKTLILGILLSVILSSAVFASQRATVTLGEDLNQGDKAEMLNVLGYEDGDDLIYITNQEERRYLGQWVSPQILGSVAISSSIVETAEKGSGISVKLYNITWVTEDMVISALTTAGVEDARVMIAAPFAVSGTAALTGVLKGFEDVTGDQIPELRKEVANEELAKTVELGDLIGSDNASAIINQVKEEVIRQKLNDPEEIRTVIEQIARQYNITLTDEQIQGIVDLMSKIAEMDLDLGKIQQQLKNVSKDLKATLDENEEVKNLFTKILEWFKGLIDRVIDWARE